MIINNISKEIFKANNKNIVELLKSNFSNEMLDELYFLPKKIDKEVIYDKIDDENYINKVLNTINYFKNKDIEEMIKEKLYLYESDIGVAKNVKIFLIIGLDTTTIYSTKFRGEDVTVLLLESTNGSEETLEMLLAHEYTHFIRKQILNKDIFEESIGERFVTEGIASNYSRQIVPNKQDSKYCIVSEKVVEWAKNNINIIEQYMIDKKDTNELMRDYFYMYVDTNITNMPARIGYVYGYLKVKEYLEKNKLKIKDIIGIDWKKII